jgi:hypothetical protein
MNLLNAKTIWNGNYEGKRFYHQHRWVWGLGSEGLFTELRLMILILLIRHPRLVQIILLGLTEKRTVCHMCLQIVPIIMVHFIS